MASSTASTVHPASPWTSGVERGDRAEDDLAERDDHQQAVALGDVVRVPRGVALALGDERAVELEGDQHGEQREAHADPELQDGEHDPADLGHADRRHVRAGRRRPLAIVARDLPPQEDQRHAHDHVAGHHHAVVQRAAAIDRLEHRLQPERQHDDPDHLHHRREAEDPVVGVVGRREPRVVQPGPAHGERGEGEAQDARRPRDPRRRNGPARRRPCRRRRRWSGRRAAPAALTPGGPRRGRGR